MNPIISVVIPVYNVERYIHRCVQSVIAQTLKDIEIILVDDESPDACPEICDELASRYTNIKVIHKKNAGLGMACNSGIEVAAGKYIAFLDSDDWVDSEMYKCMVDAAERYGAQMVFSGLRRVDEHGNQTPMGQASKINIYDSLEKVRELGLDMIASSPEIAEERRIMMSAKVVLYNWEMIDSNRIRFNSEREIISEDLFFNLDCLEHAECVVELPRTFYNYFYNTGSLSQSYRQDRFDKTMVMYKELLRRYSPMGVQLSIRANRMIIGYTRTILRQLVNNRSLSRREMRDEFMSIANSPVWKTIEKEYPVRLMPFSHRLVFKSIVKGDFFPVWALLSVEKLVRGNVC